MTEPQKVAPFDPGAVPTRYRYELLAEHLAQLIDAGELRPNVPLPAERRLAEQFGVSLGTARRATGVLRARGLVITLRSKGTYVAPAQSRMWDGRA
ncbi:winged helix-turn-helix domain-containing protein [Amycolatopsis taiwanensis]|uniref:winged helix-turn-helix domain-containing protein n=1 Tax=Amycolatopsis taiwanensis TaxID=342230 RepID=UPI000A037245|nr:winged helix-turn-helix domain-containing protein [Amycolatopsis taiwanensis]